MKIILFISLLCLFHNRSTSQFYGSQSLSHVLIMDYPNEIRLHNKIKGSKHFLETEDGKTIDYDKTCNCFLYSPHEPGETLLFLKKNDAFVDSMVFNVLQDPVPDVVFNKNPFQNTIQFSEINNLDELTLDAGLGLYKYEIVSFQMLVVGSGGVRILYSDSNQITDKMKYEIELLSKGSSVQFNNITLKRSDGKFFVLRNISLQII
ncbi:hypothetical protein [Parvicella tangerina]|uniref:Uncharacterized protein n=1 Tax=Parvicella tangerina TaxID=2829795 RepID=A0A916NIC5_9FLAO|nr:hypothetical protein [Parvicella tangerina]CAG5084888.1 hypothetical protein CRYO30217_02592 [Parvicella tangerina]